MFNGEFEPGDLVTRGDGDIWVVVLRSPGRSMIRVRCTKAPPTGWAEVGDIATDFVQYYTIWKGW